jgi:proteasome lid subunit RPN8/RPN11
MLILTDAVQQEIRLAGERDYPGETCGFILGKTQGNGDRTGDGVLAVRNSREASETYHRFAIAPLDFLRAEREAAQSGRDIVGVYHSHPDHPARPSEYDLEHGLPFYSYVIVSVGDGRAQNLTSWRLQDDRSRFDEEQVLVS